MRKITGQLDGETYVIRDADGGILRQVPLSQVDAKLRAAISRNGWQSIPEMTNG